MKTSLAGHRIALFEARLEAQLAALVRRNGGEPVCVPAVREVQRDASAELSPLFDTLLGEPVFLFTTGVGVASLFDGARALGREGALRGLLARGTLVCRGPKPVAALHREGLKAHLLAAPPYTTAELLAALDGVPLAGRRVIVLHYGERSEELRARLEQRGAVLIDLLLYEWALPQDPGPLEELVRELAAGGFSAAAFTSQIQARNLFAVAERLGQRAALSQGLRSLVVAAVGPTCARALRDLGVHPQVVPESPKMGPMLEALALRLKAQRQ